MKADLVTREPQRLKNGSKKSSIDKIQDQRANTPKNLSCTTARLLPTATSTSAPR